MINDNLTTNILRVKTLAQIEIDPSKLWPSNLIIQGFNQNEKFPMGSIKLKTMFGDIEKCSPFFFIDADTTYNTLTSRLWMHKY